MSNSTSLNGGAILFFTTFTRVRLPITTGLCGVTALRAKAFIPTELTNSGVAGFSIL